jgi:L-alanine-DL-glutamate epimerase-like enolase superfamily enzyme
VIETVAVFPLKARLREPFRTARGQHESLDNVLVVIQLSDGTSGFGEAAVAPHVSGESVVETRLNLESVAPRLIGKSVRKISDLAGTFDGLFEKNPCAAAALEMACFDALARHRRLPLWRLFGSARHVVRTDMTIVLGSKGMAGKRAREIVKAGFRAIKVKLEGDPEKDLERASEVARIAKRCSMLLDANQSHSAESFLELLSALRRRGVRPSVVEQPVPKDDWDGLGKITREARIPVIADESAATIADVHKIVRGSCASGINIKLMKFGILRALEAIKIARKGGLQLMIGAMMESELAVAAGAHLAAGTGAFRYVDLDSPFFLAERVCGPSVLRSDGVFELQRVRSGIGVVPQAAHEKP